MPWLAYDFKDFTKIKIYQEYKNKINGIPCLLVINTNDGTCPISNGRGMVENEGKKSQLISQDIMFLING